MSLFQLLTSDDFLCVGCQHYDQADRNQELTARNIAEFLELVDRDPVANTWCCECGVGCYFYLLPNPQRDGNRQYILELAHITSIVKRKPSTGNVSILRYHPNHVAQVSW